MVDEFVVLVLGSRVLDVVEDGVQNVNAESPWSQFLIKSGIDDSLKNRDHGSELVGVRDDLSNGLVNAEMKAGLNFEGLEFLPDRVNHPVKLVEMLLVDFDDVRE